MASNSKLCPSASPATVITDSPLHHINPSFPFPFFVPQCWMSMLPPASGTFGQKSMNWRKGKWFEEEEVYTRKLIEAFNAGLLLIPSGTTLRSFLSEKLSCDPMRITKKFAGSSCIGKQVFTACDTNANLSTMTKMQEELADLEEKFQAKVEIQRALECCPLSPQSYLAALHQYQLTTLMRDASLQQEYLTAVTAQQMYYSAWVNSCIGVESTKASLNLITPTPPASNTISDISDVHSSRNTAEVYNHFACDMLSPKGTVLSAQLKSNLAVGACEYIPSNFKKAAPTTDTKTRANKRSKCENEPVLFTRSAGEDAVASDLLLNFFKAASSSSMKDDAVHSDPSTDAEEQLSVCDACFGFSSSISDHSLSKLGSRNEAISSEESRRIYVAKKRKHN